MSRLGMESCAPTNELLPLRVGNLAPKLSLVVRQVRLALLILVREQPWSDHTDLISLVAVMQGAVQWLASSEAPADEES